MQKSLTSRIGGTSVRDTKRSVRFVSTSFSAFKRFSSISAWAAYASLGSDTKRSASRSPARLSSAAVTGALGAAAMASVMPSDKTFRQSVVIMMNKPGNSACHQRPERTPARASARMLPQVGVGSGMPALMNANDASNTIASATHTTVNTKMGAKQLRMTCFTKIHGAFAPETMAART